MTDRVSNDGALTPARSASTRIKAAIIDLDGTLLDTAGDFVTTINRMRQDLNLPEQLPQQIMRYVGKGTEYLISKSLEADCTPETAARLYEAALASYMSHYQLILGDYCRPFAGVTAGLNKLKAANIRLSCVTNKPFRFAEALLVRFGYRTYFEQVLGGDSVARKKPDPLPLLTVMAAFGCSPDETAMIGDSANDALAARNAGCRVWLVDYGYNHGEPIHTVDCDGIVSSLECICF